MAGGFDLRAEPWIPVRLADGASVRVGLRELFRRAHEIADVELPVPPAASGLLRILAAMTVRIADLDGVPLGDGELAEDLEKWLAERDRMLARGRFTADAVDGYLDTVVPEGRFDLFDPVRPFLQDPRLRAECVDAKGVPNTSGVNKLVFGRPTGVNGAILFGHFTDADPVPVPAAEAAWHMIAQLYYGPSGQCTPRRVPSDKRQGNGEAGPLRKSLSFHAWAPDLFTTLVLGIPAPADEVETDGDDGCPWEEDLRDPGDAVALTWPGRLLTGRARHAVLLLPSDDGTQVTDAYVTWSTHLPAQAAPDPHVILDVPKSGGAPYARQASGQRALWRDLDALLLEGDDQGTRPLTLEDLPDSVRPLLRVRAYGFDQDGQQRDAGWFEATTPPVLQWQAGVGEEADAMAERVKWCHIAAEEVAGALRYAAMLAWKLTTAPPEDPTEKVTVDYKKPGPWAHKAAAGFWPRAENEFWRLLRPEVLDEPARPAFVRAAFEALDAAMGTARADIRGARARNRARAVIRRTLTA